MTNQFFLVWNLERGIPTFKHTSFHSAREESLRLAKQHPGEEFVVLASLGRSVCSNPLWEVDEMQTINWGLQP